MIARELNRREVLRSSVAGTALAASAVVSGGWFSIIAEKSWAATAAALKPHEFKTLVRFARDILPHPQLEDSHYVAAVTKLDTLAAHNPQQAVMLREGVHALDSGGSQLWRERPEKERHAVIEDFVKTPFFAHVRQITLEHLYRHPDVWTLIGYEGSSVEYGGYLERGFDDIDWLPEE